MRTHRLLLPALALWGGLGILDSRAAAETVDLRPVADTSLLEIAPSSSLGGGEFFNVGTAGNGNRNRGLIRFDLDGWVPANATVTSATLQFEVVGTPVPSVSQPAIMAVHRMLNGWGEGTQAPANPFAPGFGAPALAGEATWTHRFFDSPEVWGAPGGLAGVDYVGTPSATTSVEGEGLYMFSALPRLVGDVQGWVDDPDSNHGWMMRGLFEEDLYTARRIGDRGDPFAAALLTVTFEPIPEPGSLALWGLALGGVAVRVCRRRRLWRGRRGG